VKTGVRKACKVQYAIRHENGTYFGHWTGAGPAFGVDVMRARKFPSRADAALEMEHWAVCETEIVRVPREFEWLKAL